MLLVSCFPNPAAGSIGLRWLKKTSGIADLARRAATERSQKTSRPLGTRWQHHELRSIAALLAVGEKEADAHLFARIRLEEVADAVLNQIAVDRVGLFLAADHAPVDALKLGGEIGGVAVVEPSEGEEEEGGFERLLGRLRAPDLGLIVEKVEHRLDHVGVGERKAERSARMDAHQPRPSFVIVFEVGPIRRQKAFGGRGRDEEEGTRQTPVGFLLFEDFGEGESAVGGFAADDGERGGGPSLEIADPMAEVVGPGEFVPADP